jgi:uncharacterized protein YcgI (DUF1989 family)
VKLHKKILIEPQTGVASTLKKNNTCRVIDAGGKQVADLVAFNLIDKKEKLSTGVTIDNNSSLNIKIGEYLFSSQYHVTESSLLRPVLSVKVNAMLMNVRQSWLRYLYDKHVRQCIIYL